jgi:hypothetical protein
MVFVIAIFVYVIVFVDGVTAVLCSFSHTYACCTVLHCHLAVL